MPFGRWPRFASAMWSFGARRSAPRDTLGAPRSIGRQPSWRASSAGARRERQRKYRSSRIVIRYSEAPTFRRRLRLQNPELVHLERFEDPGEARRESPRRIAFGQAGKKGG